MPARLSIQTQMKISPLMVLAGKLLRVPTFELDGFIKEALDENPVLERGYTPLSARDSWINDRKRWDPYPFQTYSSGLTQVEKADEGSDSWDNQDLIENLSYNPSILETLTDQVRLLANSRCSSLVEQLLSHLDGHGYLDSSLEEIAQDLNVSIDELEPALEVLHQLEPPGIGARNLQECLLIQICHLEENGADFNAAHRMLVETWNEFCKKNWRKAARQLMISEEVAEAAGKWIAYNLSPYPLDLDSAENNSFSSTPVFPDFVITRNSDLGHSPFKLEIPGEEAFKLRVNGTFTRSLERQDFEIIEGQAWITDRVERARIFINSLEQRWITMRRIGEEIIRSQVDYLAKGSAYLKPLTRLQVADRVGLHESTVSRAVSDKWTLLPDRRFVPTSVFFDHSLPTKDTIQRIIAQENIALSDQEIAIRLQAKGFTVARRTVAKYRQQLSLSSSHVRHSQANPRR